MQAALVELAVFVAFYLVGVVVHACHAAHRARTRPPVKRHRHRHHFERHGLGAGMAVAGHAFYTALQDYALHLAEYVGHFFR